MTCYPYVDSFCFYKLILKIVNFSFFLCVDFLFISCNVFNVFLSGVSSKILGSLRYKDYGLRTTAGRALSFVCSTGLSRANIER